MTEFVNLSENLYYRIDYRISFAITLSGVNSAWKEWGRMQQHFEEQKQHCKEASHCGQSTSHPVVLNLLCCKSWS